MHSLIHKIIYNCRDASYITVQKEFSRASYLQRFRLYLHMLICKPCRIFDKQIVEISTKMKEISCNQENHENFYKMDHDCKARISKDLDHPK